MKFCSQCGHPVEFRIPKGDNRERYICEQCDTIHYQNPHIITGCVPCYGNQILLCKRAIEPRKGLWTLPAGFMENGETTQQAATRETFEEALTRVTIEDLYFLYNLPHIHQVYIFFRASMDELEYGAGEESLEVRLFHEEEIPWDNLAFAVIKKTLRYFFEDRRNNHFPIRVEDIHHPIKA